MATTIWDIAKAAEVSIATVSRVLNNTDLHKVSQGTRDRVLKTARLLNYRPNAIARGLVMRKIKTVGVAIDRFESLNSPFLSGIVAGIGQVLEANDYSLQLGVSRGSERVSNIHMVRMVEENRVDGVIVYGEETPRGDVKKIKRVGVPMVLINYPSEERNIPLVRINNVNAMRTATQHLIALGRKRLAILLGLKKYHLDIERLAGFDQAVAEAGERVLSTEVLTGKFDFEYSREKMLKVFESKNHPTGVVCSDDNMALAVIRAAYERGLRVPEDVSVVGFNDILYTHMVNPPLTTMRISAHDMGMTAAEMLVAQLAEEPLESIHREAAAELMIRESCGARLGVTFDE